MTVMTYLGRVKDGVLVLEGSPALTDGTLVRTEPVESGSGTAPAECRPGSVDAVLSAAGHWHGDAEEMDRLLAELSESKWAKVKAQQAGGDEPLPP